MAESFAFDIAGSLLGKIASSAVQEIALAWGVESDLDKLNDSLTTIQAVLLDAEYKRAENHLLNNWLLKLKDFMYDAEDVLDEFQYKDLRSRVLKGESTRRKIRNYFSCSNPLAFRLKMGHKMKALRDRLEYILAEMSKFQSLNQTLRVQSTPVPTPVVRRRETHSSIRPSDVIGRDHDKECIIESLLHGDDGETVSVIPIVGLGGLGKTTLAKLVYNDDRVKNHFKKKIWLCISEDFEVKKLAKEIIKLASGEDVRDCNMEHAKICLQNTLGGKKFLLIMDDVWNEDRDKWNELKSLLLDGAIGSKIVVTTRSPLVASTMSRVPAHNLKGLSHKECLSLFVKHAFDEGEEKHHLNLMQIGSEVVKKCSGVPLAVKTLGSLLYGKNKDSDWIAIRDSEFWKLKQGENDILPALRLSYEHLPSHLKLCFSYCSLYPKDYEFNSIRLGQFWMAQGFVRSSDEGQEPEDICDRYINELCSRSFFQDVIVFGYFIIFKMHDLVHDLALLIAKDEMSTINTPSQSISKTIRHVAFWDRVSCETVPSVLLNQTRLRSFKFWCIDGTGVVSNSFVDTCISRFKYMRSLDLGGVQFKVLANSIGDLKFLRLLDLSNNESIKKLPKSIYKLQNLQTLQMAGCSNLEELPKDIGKYFINLRDFTFTTKQVSLEIGCLPTSLRNLMIYNCENLKSLGEGLECLTALRTLVIFNCKSLERLPRGLSCSTTIQNLALYGCPAIDTSELEEDTENLRLRLQFLGIGNLPKFEVFPRWIQGSVDSLEYLGIMDCSELLTLPAWLQNFTSLQKLAIVDCPKLSALPDGMSRLTYLGIEECPKLSVLPEGMSRLTELEINAEYKRAEDHLLNNWLLKLKDFMYDAEDVLDEFQYKDLRSRVLKGESTRRKVRNYFSSSNPLAFRLKMGHKMKALTDRLDDISAKMSKFQYLNQTLRVQSTTTPVVHRRETHSSIRPSDVIGRDHDKECIIESLLHGGDGETVSVIPIVGLGGLGKTSLAKLVYNDDTVKNHFEKKIWLCVSEDFQVKKLAKEIIKLASGEDVGDCNMEHAKICLQNTLCGKRFLLIMDDVWNEDRDKWNELKSLLLDGAIGSKIVVTTRSPLVASTMSRVPAHNLKGLSHKECLSLFVKHAFDEGEEKHHLNLMQIGSEVVKKCRGVPLAVKTLGSLLYGKNKDSDWIAIRDSEFWKLKQGENDILPTLRLSYEHLPSHLKLCFSYCSLFPKDFEFNSINLVQFWMAQGLVRLSDEGQEPEDICNQYINELCSRSFFQDVSVSGFLIEFKMHDLVHDLALLIAKDEMSTINIPTQSISKTIRHVAFWDRASCETVPSVLLNQTRLRSFKFWCIDDTCVVSNSFVDTCISRFKYMRSLDLDGVQFTVLDNSIGDLKFLRLLDLTNNKSIKKLPKSIYKLQNLQSLQLDGCSNLGELPKDIGKYLINLRCLTFTTKQVSLEIGCLPSLRFLMISYCENLKSLGEGLECLTALRTLFIVDCKSLERLPRGLSCSTTIKNLYLYGCPAIDTSELEEDTENLRLRLQFLAIGNLPKLEVFPRWIQGSADSLEYLGIDDCSELLTLPAWLQNFTSLQKLEIEECSKLSALPDGMSHLTGLSIEDCPKLSVLPEGMSRLTELVIGGCNELTNKCQPETGEEWKKMAHVPKITLDGKVIKSPEN